MDSQESVWKSDVSYIMLAVYLGLFGGFFILGANNSDFPQDIFKGPYIPLDNWIVLCFLLVIIILAACGISKFLTTKYALYEDRLVIKRIYTGEVSLPIDDLQNWQYRPSKGGRSIYSNYIVLVFKEKTLRLDENSISDLSELADILKDKYPQLETDPKSSNTVINAFFNLLNLALCVCPFFLLVVWASVNNESKGTQMHHMAVRLSDDPRFIEHTHKRSPSTYVMVLRSGDIGNFDLTFNVSDPAEKEKYASNLHSQDTIPMDILQYDYNIKVSKKREPDFLDKHLSWYQIPIKEFWYYEHTQTH
jgi:hypothetical protein